MLGLQVRRKSVDDQDSLRREACVDAHRVSLFEVRLVRSALQHASAADPLKLGSSAQHLYSCLTYKLNIHETAGTKWQS